MFSGNVVYCPGAMLDINGVSLSPQQAINIISMIRWIQTSRLSIKNSISLSAGNVVYCPGAMLDINGVMLAFSQERGNGLEPFAFYFRVSSRLVVKCLFFPQET